MKKNYIKELLKKIDINKTKRILKNPITVILATLLGVAIGLINKEASNFLGPLGQMYLYFLQMSVIPIIISSIISNTGKLVGSKIIKQFLTKAILIFFLTSSFCSMAGILGGFFLKPGSDLSTENKKILNSFIESSEEEIDLELNILTPNPIKAEDKKKILDFLSEIVPSNIFDSLTSGRALELVFFFIILGIGVGMIKNEEGGKMIIQISTALFLTFQKINNWALYLLPFGLICLISNQIASTGTQIIFPMLKFILIFYLLGTVILIINYLILWKRSKTTLLNTLKKTIEPNLLAFTTRSSFACIPSCINSLEKRLNFERITTNLFVPLGITLGRYGNIFYFSLATMFIAQIYNTTLGINEMMIIAIGSVLAGVATAGSTGISTLVALSIITVPLGVPLDVILIVLIALDVIIDPMRTLLIINTNLMSGSIISKPYEAEEGKRKPLPNMNNL